MSDDKQPFCRIDFSQFHPLDHWAASRECWGWYGGPIQHIKLWWAYQGPGYNEDDWEKADPLTLDEATKEAWPDPTVDDD